MRSSNTQELLDELHGMLGRIDPGAEAVNAVFETATKQDAEGFAWSDFQNLVTRCVCSFYANVASPHRIAVCEAWTLGKRMLAQVYPEAGGAETAFLDFAADVQRYKDTIVALLVEGLLAEYQQKQTRAVTSVWLSSICWDQKISVARFLKREYFTSNELPAALLPDFQLALQLDELAVLVQDTSRPPNFAVVEE